MDEQDDRKLIPWWPDAGVTLGGLSKATMWRLIKSGELRSLKIGRRRFVAVRDIDAYIDQRREAGQGGEAA